MGETETKGVYNIRTYKYYQDSYVNLCDDIAGTQYDVAHVKWGGNWQMPSYNQFDELRKNCFSVEEWVNGIKGFKFTSKKNGASIFLPLAGYRRDSDLYTFSESGLYWSSTEYSGSRAYHLYFYNPTVLIDNQYRYYGYSVRPVTMYATRQSSRHSSVSLCPDGNHPHMIDLGLPSGTKWACCNVGANKPEGYGGCYAWGETATKNVYNENTHKFYDDGSYVILGWDITGTQYDVAHAKWGGTWQMPSDNQIMELLNNCTYEWTTKDGVKGGKFTSKKNGASIFMPATGYRRDSNLYTAGSYGHYWSSRRDYDSFSCAYGLRFSSGKAYLDFNISRSYGRSVRPVSSY